MKLLHDEPGIAIFVSVSVYQCLVLAILGTGPGWRKVTSGHEPGVRLCVLFPHLTDCAPANRRAFGRRGSPSLLALAVDFADDYRLPQFAGSRVFFLFAFGNASADPVA